ncbi:MAG: hypothetical protein WAQ28_02015 [Bacteroidia bacterium]
MTASTKETERKPILRENLKTIAQKYGYGNDPKLRAFKNLFTESEWKKLKKMNTRSRSLKPKQLEFIKEVLGPIPE